ncbi:transporter substrate-binding domain-containing protein [Streptomyces marispadix]|uniref:Transporter substrate-binding domain-containing protein n=1 Tax=Streptomyces marispadix TaxID=2922868 RepID=A0ABS9SZC5_9ACTN|nr:transporter substrate-binding domain-containing protein [Streptomyces marispadix]MCH6161626.1 transporter substrate-binding domain-containing protein [Streptomyces marispadix]
MNARFRRSVLVLRALAVPAVLGLCASCTGSGDSKPDPGDAGSARSSQGGAPGGSLLGSGQVRVLVKNDQPGFSTREGKHGYRGFDVALSRFLARELGFGERLVGAPGSERERMLRQGTGDLAVATYTITDIRDKKIDFTAPYLKTYQGVLVRKGEKDIKQLDDLGGKRLCTAVGSTSDPGSAPGGQEREQIVKAVGRDARIALRSDHGACVKGLRDGEFDAVWTDRVLLEGFAQSDSGGDVEVVEDINIENRQFYGVGVPEGHEKDCRRINHKLKEFLRETWRDAFSEQFPRLADEDAGFEQHYKPTESEFKAYEEKSCGAK